MRLVTQILQRQRRRPRPTTTPVPMFAPKPEESNSLARNLNGVKSGFTQGSFQRCLYWNLHLRVCFPSDRFTPLPVHKRLPHWKRQSFAPFSISGICRPFDARCAKVIWFIYLFIRNIISVCNYLRFVPKKPLIWISDGINPVTLIAK